LFASASAKLIKNAQLKVYKGAPHGVCSTHKDQVNQELLASSGADRLVLVVQSHECLVRRVVVQRAELGGRVEVMVPAPRPPALAGGNRLLQ
jgi:hypothetical protein